MYNMEDLRKISFFETLDEKELKLLSTFSRKKTFSKGEVVFYEKDMPNSLILLTEGVLKVYKTDLKNNEIVLHRFKPTSLVAEMVTLEGFPYPASGVFDTDGTIIEIDFEKFKKEFFNNPEVALTSLDHSLKK